MSAGRPTPTLRGEEHLYFERTKAGELVFQSCRHCGAQQWYPRVLCATCGSTDVNVERASGQGEIHSFTTLLRAGHPSRATDIPYTIVLVDLVEGVRVFGELVDVNPEDVRVGLLVEVDFQDLADVTVPVFRRRPDHAPTAGMGGERDAR